VTDAAPATARLVTPFEMDETVSARSNGWQESQTKTSLPGCQDKAQRRTAVGRGRGRKRRRWRRAVANRVGSAVGGGAGVQLLEGAGRAVGLGVEARCDRGLSFARGERVVGVITGHDKLAAHEVELVLGRSDAKACVRDERVV
jgi:hypothetical protein